MIRSGLPDPVLETCGVEHVETRLVWDPAWHPEMIHEEAW